MLDSQKDIQVAFWPEDLSMKASLTRFTYDDYLALPNDGKRYEIIEGELLMTPAPSTEHQDLHGRLFALIRLHTDKNDLGKTLSAPTDVVLSMVDLVQPDILFVANGRANIIAKKNIVGIPNLIVEILSPNTGKRDREEKWKLYQRYELPEYWIVDPETHSVDVFIYFDNHLNLVETLTVGQQLKAQQIAGLTIDLSDIFRK